MNLKTIAHINYILSLCSYIVAIIAFFSLGSPVGIVCLSLGTMFMCFATAAWSRHAKEKKEKEERVPD
jgi:hypothetical protein